MILSLISIAGAGDLGLTPYAGTDFPLMAGAGITHELPGRLRIDGAAGLLPGPYWDTVNRTLVSAEVYSEDTAELIDILLTGALVLRLEAGWRPWERRGFFFTAGYQHLGLAGGSTNIALYADGITASLYEAASSVFGDLEVLVVPSMVLGRTGWEWHVRESILLRATLGFAYTVRSRSEVSMTDPPRNPIAAALSDSLAEEAEAYLDDVFESWVHTPMIGVYSGFRF